MTESVYTPLIPKLEQEIRKRYSDSTAVLYYTGYSGEDRKGDLWIFVIVYLQKVSGVTYEFFQLENCNVDLILVDRDAAFRFIFQPTGHEFLLNLARAQILFCNDANVEIQKSIAQGIFEKGRSDPTPLRVIRYREVLEKLLNAMERNIHNEDVLRSLNNQAFSYILKYYSAVNAKWEREPMWLFQRLSNINPALHSVLTTYLMEEDPRRQADVLRKCVRIVLEPHGGFLPKNWRFPQPVKSIEKRMKREKHE